MNVADSFCETPSVWRHICPRITDLDVVVDTTKPYTEIEIPRSLRVQGAVPENDLMVDMFKLQGAFLAEVEVTQQPTGGTLELYGKGLLYIPILPHVGESDVIRYRLSINGQLSAEAQINITFS